MKESLINIIVTLWPDGENCNREFLSTCTVEELVNVIENSVLCEVPTTLPKK